MLFVISKKKRVRRLLLVNKIVKGEYISIKIPEGVDESECAAKVPKNTWCRVIECYQLDATFFIFSKKRAAMEFKLRL